MQNILPYPKIDHHQYLPKPLGNIYPMHNGKFIISNLDGLHVYDRNKKTIKYY